MGMPADDLRRPTEDPPAGVMAAGDSVGLRRELLRKRFHLATVIAPALVWFLPFGVAVAILASAVVVALGIEAARRRLRWVRYRFLGGTREMLRGHERVRLTGATYMAIAYLAAAVVLPRPVAVTAMLYNALGDAVAAIVGRRWGRMRTRWGKSWEGTGAALCVNVAAGLAVPGIGPLPAVIGAVSAALLEFLPLPLDDNLRVTLGGGAALWVATLLA